MDFVDVDEEGGGGDTPRHEELVLRPKSQDVSEEGVEEGHDEAVAEAEGHDVELRRPDRRGHEQHGTQLARADPTGAPHKGKSAKLTKGYYIYS